MTTSDTIRRLSYDADGPVDITVGIGSGAVEVHLRDEPGVDVEIRPAASDNPWAEGLTALMSWVGSAMGDDRALDLSGEAVAQARVDFGGRALSVRSAKSGHLRAVPVAVVVRAPAGSSVNCRTGDGAVTVSGRADRVEVGTTGGEISVDEATGAVRLTSGTGPIRLGPAPGGGHLRSGSGTIEVAALGGSSTVATSSGEIRLGRVTADLLVRTGTGDIAIKEAVSGTVELTSGSGSFRVGVAGPAEFDLVSTSSVARSEVPVTQKRVDGVPLRVSGRTGSGTILVHKAAV
ncbi:MULTISPECIES: DUF4097 family beta strand repeat-containing protein [Actinokineospora]|uniref:Adhesin domain-containing protein n=1 Tax=Actinokineospora fastidiosa TaxID=1816 RepID=A0A918GHS5_9PSEU|nr:MULTISPECIES: DUF4097 family beta strand repeat-containing protein [Actinokineospora]UVS81008.1 hypothetical protein Actkin_04760 [Actinokineospora sp. UTMC 2448]GGS38903.1 hypothetical protein GCM10010171_37310 [Actinokineospora fastidiosa]